MNVFDHTILEFLNPLVGRSRAFDHAVAFLANDGFVRGGVLAALIWWAWFKEKDPEKCRVLRERLLTSILLCGLSIFFARIVVAALPFRLRPICDPTNGFHFPETTTNWSAWSSFPSDHAILFGALTTCFFFISTPFGWIAAVDTLLLVCFARVYLGIHHPTDILAGLAIGVGVGLLANTAALRNRIGRCGMNWADRHPGPFYAVSFLFTHQLTVMFNDVRTLAEYGVKFCQKLFM